MPAHDTSTSYGSATEQEVKVQDGIQPAETAQRPLPASHEELCGPGTVARFLAERFLARQPALLLRYGDTSGRIMAGPAPGTGEYGYVQRFLGAEVTPEQIAWLAGGIAASVEAADVIGLRSDLLGPPLPPDLPQAPATDILPRLAGLYPLRPAERTSLPPDGARRLAETRRAMERMRLPERALLTDAWIHVGLAEAGFLSALLREAPGVSVVTSSVRRPVLRELAASLGRRLRVYECPAYPTEERQWGGDHGFLWERWLALSNSLRPAYPGEPLLVAAGIWTTIVGPIWARQGGMALDMGSVMDFLGAVASRPAVLATRYGQSSQVPAGLTLQAQLRREESLADFLAD